MMANSFSWRRLDTDKH